MDTKETRGRKREEERQFEILRCLTSGGGEE
jgi:hypothetical protein